MTYRCADRSCRQIVDNHAVDVCPRCGGRLETYRPPRLLARPATPTSDQLAMQLAIPPEDLEDFDTWARRLNREGGQAR